jgi:hypothetical protein
MLKYQNVFQWYIGDITMYLKRHQCIFNIFEYIWMYNNVFESIWVYLNVFERIYNIFSCTFNALKCIWMYSWYMWLHFECIWMYL